MKGAPPKLPYLISLLPLIRKSGATDLLLEYEDMFPFWGPLQNVSAHNAYSIQVKKEFLKLTEYLCKT